jgi:hypothetical protein
MRTPVLAICAGLGLWWMSGCGMRPSSQVETAQSRADASPQKQVRGKVRKLDAQSVKVEDSNFRWIDLQLTGQTQVTREGQPDSALTFVDGAVVQATYREENGAMVATLIDVVAVPQE